MTRSRRLHAVWLAVALVAALIAAPFTTAFAEESDAVPDVCSAPASLGRLTDELPTTRAALWAGRPLRIVALGSSSTAGAGASATRFSYPSRLAVELAQRRPSASVEIINRGLNGEDAWENMGRLQSDVIDAKPDLVIWQMGTNAILHELDYADFEHVVQEGITRMQAAHIEILLMDLQYAPRVTEVPDHRRMLDFLDAIGARNHIPVFHRYAVMKHWSDAMRSDYPRMLSSDGLHLNDTSYGCLAERLADAIVGDAAAAASRAAMRVERPAHGAHDDGH